MSKANNDMFDHKTLLTEQPPKSCAEFVHSDEGYGSARMSLQSLTTGLNPLVSAASQLLSLVAQIKRSPPPKSVDELYQDLCEQIQRFEQQALLEGVEHGDARVARYLLCTVVDEAVMTAPWEEKGPWTSSSLLSVFHAETTGGETFFVLLERFEQGPVRYLLLLELIYFCLSLGFEGKYQLEHCGTQGLEQIRDRLYRQIHHMRGGVSRVLSPHWQGRNDQRRGLVRIVPWWWVTLFTLISLGAMYMGFAWELSEQRDRVLLPFLQLDAPAFELQFPARIF